MADGSHGAAGGQATAHKSASAGSLFASRGAEVARAAAARAREEPGVAHRRPRKRLPIWASDSYEEPKSEWTGGRVRRVQDIPDRFMCPITETLMRKPARMFDGTVVEEHAGKFWLSRHVVNPRSGDHIHDDSLTPEPRLQAEIEGMLAVSPGLEAELTRWYHLKFLEHAVRRREEEIAVLFERSELGERLKSGDAYWKVFNSPDERKEQKGLIARPAGLPPVAGEPAGGRDGIAAGVQRGTRQQTQQQFEESRLVMTDDVRNFLARLCLQRYERVFQDWGFTRIEFLASIRERHLVEMGLNTGARRAVLAAVQKIAKSVATKRRRDDEAELRRKNRELAQQIDEWRAEQARKAKALHDAGMTKYHGRPGGRARGKPPKAGATVKIYADERDAKLKPRPGWS